MARIRKLVYCALLLGVFSFVVLVVTFNRKTYIIRSTPGVESVLRRQSIKTLTAGQLIRLAQLYGDDISGGDDIGTNRADASRKSFVGSRLPSLKTMEVRRGLNSTWSDHYNVTHSLPKVDRRSGTCSKAKNVVFLKTHKTGSDTTAQLFFRHGYLNDLSMVLPRGEWSLGWPYQLETKDYIQTNKSFNIMCLHAVYNKTKMATLMPANTKYVTILRNPWSEFKSAFDYFGWKKLVPNANTSEPLEIFLKHRNEIYEREKFGSPNLRNFMAFDLGFPPNHYNNLSEINNYVKEINDNFSLVMILEYFDESLVLLRRLLCWQLTDILYVPINISHKRILRPDYEERLYKDFSTVDYALYDHFKTKVEDQIAREPEFIEELALFKKVNSDFKLFCLNVTKNTKLTMKIGKSKWNDEYVIDGEFCRLSRIYLLDWIKIMKNKLHNIPNQNHSPNLWAVKPRLP